MSTTSHKTPESLLQQLGQFRRHVAVVKISEALVAATFAFLAAWLVVLVVERFVEMAAWQRAILLITGAAGFGIALPQALRRWVWNTRRASHVARLLNSRFPSLSDEIVAVLNLGEENQGGASDRLIDAAMQQTGEDAARQDFTVAMPKHRRGLWALSTGVAAIAASAAFVVAPAAAQNAWQRFINPWTDTARFTFVQLEPLPSSKVVPYGESISLDARLNPNSSTQPETATALLSGSAITAQRRGSLYSFSLPGQSSKATLTVVAGDSSRSMEIVPKTRPELVDVVARIQLPEYLQIEKPRESKSLSGRFALPEGSQAEFTLNANRKLAQATFNQQPIETIDDKVITQAIPVTAAEKFTVQWLDEHGLAGSQPIELEIRPVADRSPDCSLQRIEQSVVLEQKTIRLRYSASDDYGVKHVGIEWQGIADPVSNPTPTKGETVLFAGGPTANSISAESVLSPSLENIAPQVLELRLFTQDYRPGSERVYSLPQVIQVMSAEQHVAWVADQMKRWQSQSDAVYERELALNEENRALQALPDSELAKPENIRRLEQQAAAERENAQQLEQSIEDGRKLVEQALQNENMRPDQVRRWSESLQRMQKIAGQRMPDISRKLARLADDFEKRAEARANDKSAKGESDDSTSGESKPRDGKTTGDEKSKENEQRGNKANVDPSEEPNADPPDSEDMGNPSQSGKNGQKPDGSEPQGDEDESPKIPNLNQQENSMLDEDRDETGPEAEQAPSSSGRLTIPETELEGPPQKPSDRKDGDQQPPSDGKDDQQPSLDQVVEDQDKLLKEFRESREAMGDIMAEFENTTFVKRLKAASLSQLTVASRLNSVMAELFGADETASSSQADVVSGLTEAQTGMYENLTEIEADLSAYQKREPDDARQQILDEMKSLNMRIKLEEMPLRLQRNLNGDCLHRTEFWADVFDRWAEELVPPQADSGGAAGSDDGERPSLPPSIILEVLRLIEDETQLRDETRSFEQGRKAMGQSEVGERLSGLAIHQMAIQERTLNAIEDVNRLPNATQAFEEELKKLNNAVTAMNEASSMLVDGLSGEPTIAAETAAIEALLAARRNQANNQPPPRDRSKGQGDGSESLATMESPFDILKSGEESGLRPAPRDVGAASGRTAERVPEAYRSGLDSFLNRLRKLDQMQQR